MEAMTANQPTTGRNQAGLEKRRGHHRPQIPHYNQYLNALSHFNGITGHRQTDIILRRNPGGKISQTSKGQKLKSQPKSSRGRGQQPLNLCKELLINSHLLE
jgi:hypothetical protein